MDPDRKSRIEGSRQTPLRPDDHRVWRCLCYTGFNPAIDDILNVRGAIRVVTGYGQLFSAGDEISALGYPIKPGEKVRYAYTRPATANEIAAYLARPNIALSTNELEHRRFAAILYVAQGERAPNTGALPTGEEIWVDQIFSTQERRRWIVSGNDGYLYHLTHDMSGIAVRGSFNAGLGTIAYRVPFLREIYDAIRTIGG